MLYTKNGLDERSKIRGAGRKEGRKGGRVGGRLCAAVARAAGAGSRPGLGRCPRVLRRRARRRVRPCCGEIERRARTAPRLTCRPQRISRGEPPSLAHSPPAAAPRGQVQRRDLRGGRRRRRRRRRPAWTTGGNRERASRRRVRSGSRATSHKPSDVHRASQAGSQPVDAAPVSIAS